MEELYEEMNLQRLKDELKIQTDKMSYAEKSFYKAKSKCIELDYLIREFNEETQ